jgi:hypothetical protein
MLSWIRAGCVAQVEQETSLVENTAKISQLEDRPSWRDDITIDQGLM